MDSVTFERFRGIIHRSSGIALNEDKIPLLVGRVRKRMLQLGLTNHSDYLQRVERDQTGEELKELINKITTHHTYFFREAEHFRTLQALVTDRALDGQRRFRIWSAASSSGEEPYSLGMVLLDWFDKANIQPDLKVLATDISTDILKRAFEARYPKEAVSKIPPELRIKFFSPDSANRQMYRAKQRLREAISFRSLNLSAPPFPMKGPFDAIFCRNVLIYFDEPGRNRLIKEFVKLLSPGGLLFVGLTESLLGMDHGLTFRSPSVYEKPATSSAAFRPSVRTDHDDYVTEEELLLALGE